MRTTVHCSLRTAHCTLRTAYCALHTAYCILSALTSSDYTFFASSSYIAGGIAEEVTIDIIKAAFLPFGKIRDINIPMDHESGEHQQHQRHKKNVPLSS